MGDGRFYSVDQFFSIIFLTMLMTMMSIGIMLNYYKSSGEESNNRVLGPSIILGLVLFFNFCEMLVISESAMMTCRSIIVVLFVVCNLWTLYLIVLYRAIKKPFLFASGIILWVVPMAIYGIALWLNFDRVKVIEYGLYLTMAIFIFVMVNYNVPYRVSDSVFSDVKELMVDYVIITDERGGVMYRNKSVTQSGLFVARKLVDMDCVECFFNIDVALKSMYGRWIIQYDMDKVKYLSYTKKPIYKGDEIKGYILTFSDVTQLVGMLDQLKREQKVMEDNHRRLMNYKQVVYEIEKEKEINNLLDEIAGNQAVSMRALKAGLDALDTEAVQDEALESLLNVAKQDLKNVRQAVRTYMNYYEIE